jgi:saccharopine dehydrogenase-like NADP-dependent oxidoreductase
MTITILSKSEDTVNKILKNECAKIVIMEIKDFDALIENVQDFDYPKSKILFNVNLTISDIE